MEFITWFYARRSKPADREKNVFVMSVEDFERTNRPRKNYRVNEYMDHNQVVRPYYDYDRGTVDNIEQVKPLVIREFKEIMEKLHPDAEVAYADRSGVKPDKGTVISLRAYVKGYKMRVSDIKLHIEQTFGNDIPEHLDRSIYKSHDQCLGVINATKTLKDFRILKPLTHENEKRAFLAQYMYGDEKDIKVEVQEKVEGTITNKKKNAATITESATAQIANLVEQVQTININLHLNYNSVRDWDTMRLALQQQFGFDNLRELKKFDLGYEFDANRDGNCPLCKNRRHSSNHWYCHQLMPDLWLVKNYSEHCTKQFLEFENLNIIKSIIASPKSHRDYGALIARIYQQILRYTDIGDFYAYEKGRWHRLHKEEVRLCVGETLINILQTVAKYLNDQRLYFDTEEKNEDTRKKIEKEYQNVVTAIQFVKDVNQLEGIIRAARTKLFDKSFGSRLDSNIHLFALNNGVIDLKEVKFRPSTPEDMVSMTAGYDWTDDEDEETQGEFDTFTEQIYPIPKEREGIQTFLGYCLLGDHFEKVIMLLTDKRNGYNGKSTVAKLVKAGMGINQSDDDVPSYVATGDCRLLYKSEKRSETANSHSTGLIKLKKARLAIFEEPDPTYQLNNQLLKDLNGGNTTFQGRDMNSKKTHSFVWGCKFMIMFNENNLPQMDVADKALLSRAIVMHHRARFYTDEEEYKAHAHEEYTYRATNVEAKFPKWRIYYLKWAMEGLRRYWREGFTGLPEECKRLKNALVDSQDVVKHFLEDFCEDGTAEDFISARDLYAAFVREHPSEKDPKLRMGCRKFHARVQELWKLIPPQSIMRDKNKICSPYIGKSFKIL